MASFNIFFNSSLTFTTGFNLRVMVFASSSDINGSIPSNFASYIIDYLKKTRK
jgi:hypothetical protein